MFFNLKLFLLIGGAMELGEMNSGEGSKNQLVEILVEGNDWFLWSTRLMKKSFLDFEILQISS